MLVLCKQDQQTCGPCLQQPKRRRFSFPRHLKGCASVPSIPPSLQQCPFAGVACVLVWQLITSVTIYFLLGHSNPTPFLLSLAQVPSETELFFFLLKLVFPQARSPAPDVSGPHPHHPLGFSLGQEPFSYVTHKPVKEKGSGVRAA